MLIPFQTVIMNRILILVFVPLFLSCSHDYNSNALDLSFYQWNLWTDAEAGWSDEAEMEVHPPSCGWDVLHRGNGRLVRIPASVGEHFPTDYAGVVWFHARFTLPEVWAGTSITLAFEEITGTAEVYLNEQLVGHQPESMSPFSLDLTGEIYYTRDNHLSVRVTDPDPGSAGITGKIVLKSSPTGDKSHDSPAS